MGYLIGHVVWVYATLVLRGLQLCRYEGFSHEVSRVEPTHVRMDGGVGAV